jgi:HAD superfamily hydrolase (TIGR01509 family)
MTQIRATLFDIDGTLVDSNYLHVEAWSHVFAELKIEVDAWRIHRSIGMDSAAMLDELLPDDQDVNEVKDLHSRYYEELAPRLRPFAGARELLAALDARGFTVVLATSAPQDELEHLRATLRVEDSVAIITSAEDVETAKPSPDIVRVALERAQVDASEAVMIGDTVWDVAAAGRAGVACVGVMSGGISAAELLDAGAIAVYNDVAELLDQLDQSVLGSAN